MLQMLRPDVDNEDDFAYDEVDGYSTCEERSDVVSQLPRDNSRDEQSIQHLRVHHRREGKQSCGVADATAGDRKQAKVGARDSVDSAVPFADPMRFGETEFNPTRCDAYDLNWRTTIKVWLPKTVACKYIRLDSCTREYMADCR